MNSSHKTAIFYPAKVLLFGEYTIIHGGSALAIPFPKYGGHWSINNPDTGLLDFFEHLLDLDGVLKPKVETAIQEKWAFESNIPMGYGIGSSGALSAAAYDSFFEKKILSYPLLKLKLAEIEAYFHGKSSGIDPLTSFIHSPILIKDQAIEVLDGLPISDKLFLYDSQKKRNAKPLIEAYRLRLDSDPDFKDAVFALSKFNERIISELTQLEDISKSFKEISTIQFEYFQRMIPADMSALWKEGLESDQYYVKLTGAGGGGYFLVYANREISDLNLLALNET